MTPTFCWMFLLVLTLVGRAASESNFSVCDLLCNTGKETKFFGRESNPIIFPIYRRRTVNCELQSNSDEHQAIAIMRHCLKLCDELSIALEVNCFVLRSSLETSLGCHCISPHLNPYAMFLHYNVRRVNVLLKKLSTDVLTMILDSPHDLTILCEIREELFKNKIKYGELHQKCISADKVDDSPAGRKKRIVEESENTLHHETLIDNQFNDHVEVLDKAITEEDTDETLRHQEKRDLPLLENLDSSEKKIAEDSSHQDQDRLMLGEHSELKQSCKKLCNSHNQICQCKRE